MSNSKVQSNLYHCNYCRKDITNTVKIKCATCNDFDLCLECFSVGVEIDVHKNNHAYFITDQLNFPVFTLDWLASEEFLLLEGIELYGVGNWVDISEHIGTKTPTQCEKHYFCDYIDKKDNIPDLNVKFTDEEKEKAKKKIKKISKASVNRGRAKPQPSQPVQEGETGWMPKRKEFETEFENDAELTIAELSFFCKNELDPFNNNNINNSNNNNEEEGGGEGEKEEENIEFDSEAMRDIKLLLFDSYCKKLDKRQTMRQFVLDYDLLDVKKKQQRERRRIKEEREIYQATKPFLQLTTTQKYEQFVEGLLSERLLREKIKNLQEYRKLGIKSLQGIQTYDTTKKKRETEIQQRKQKESSAYLYPERTRGDRTSRYLARDRDKELKEKNEKSKKKSQILPLDINESDDVHLLSTNEKDLCSKLRIYPRQYIMIKETLIHEYTKQGTLKKTNARNLVKLDINKTNRIFEFFQNNGWINQNKIKNNKKSKSKNTMDTSPG